MPAGPPPEGPARRAVRMVLLHPSGAVLLQLHGPPHETHWACPGGGIEPGEDPRAAARRELVEETGRDDRPEDELWVWQHRFRFADHVVRQHETYFLARTTSMRIPLTEPDPSDGILTRTWMTPTRIRTLAEPVWPPDLADRIARLQRGLRPRDRRPHDVGQDRA